MPQTAVQQFLAALDNSVGGLKNAGWHPNQVSIFVKNEFHDYNQSGQANPHQLTLAELNSYLASHALPKYKGDPVTVI